MVSKNYKLFKSPLLKFSTLYPDKLSKYASKPAKLLILVLIYFNPYLP